ncbi:late embryogenesis abundant protein [Trema orientale]|uniref:Late embryogenesis abundant protein n=1 Tax=Trema orientale TaxID=63057 RepID=A0A2P5DS99_TREOI|nr:late embryogenesis abundant protein [Trema orientale]
MPRHFKAHPEKPTHPLVWCIAILCTVAAIAVIITGLVVFVGYLIIHPSAPVISVVSAHLDKIQNDLAGLLEIQVTIVIKAENDNAKAHASFSDTDFVLSFQGIPIARLVADPFEVPKNESVEFPYKVESSSIPLSPDEMQQVDLALKQDQITLDLKGSSRARWRVLSVAPLRSVRFWCHLNCQLKFHPMTGIYKNSPCTSRAK